MSRDTIYKYRRLLKIDKGAVKKAENKSYASATKVNFTSIHISPSLASSTMAVLAEMIAEVHSSRVLAYTWRNRETCGAVINTRSVALIWADQEKERDRSPSCTPLKGKRMTYGTYGCRICVRRAPRACAGRLVGAARADLYRSNA